MCRKGQIRFQKKNFTALRIDSAILIDLSSALSTNKKCRPLHRGAFLRNIFSMQWHYSLLQIPGFLLSPILWQKSSEIPFKCSLG